MSHDWQATYNSLEEYVNGNPKINIGRDIVAIPEDFKPEFHRLITEVKLTFIENNFSSLIGKTKILSKNYAESENEVITLIGLDKISQPSNLHRFLGNPVNELTNILSDPLYDLLRGNIDVEIFEQTTLKKGKDWFNNLYRLGYQEWITLTLVTMLGPTKAFRVSIDDLDVDALATEREDGGDWEEAVPNPKETRYLSFEHGRPPTFIVPDVIVQPVDLDKYFSLRTDLKEAVWISTSVSERREWLSLNTIRDSFDQAITWPAIVINTGDKLNELALVADHERFCRPDLIVECMEQEDWYRQEEMDKIQLRHRVLKPMLGTYVVLRETISAQDNRKTIGEKVARGLESKQNLEKRDPNIKLLSVNFNRSKLEPITGCLMGE
jgi:hypothetical protein